METIPQQTKELIYINEPGDPLSSPNTAMIAALYTLGIPFFADRPMDDVRELVGDRVSRKVTWYLEAKSVVPIAGEYMTTGMAIKCWNDREWLEAHPTHPITYAKYQVENYNRLLDLVKQNVPLAMVRKGERFALIPFNASEDHRQKIIDKL